jgi:hypothetical protein
VKRARAFELYVAGVCVILGILLVGQVRTQEYIGKSQIPSRRLEDLSDMLRRSDAERGCRFAGHISVLYIQAGKENYKKTQARN